jgi:hypothetical protein
VGTVEGEMEWPRPCRVKKAIGGPPSGREKREMGEEGAPQGVSTFTSRLDRAGDMGGDVMKEEGGERERT